MTALDHLVYATPDLESTVRALGERLGVSPSAGGQHVGRGTRNYLLSLGGGSYLEIIGPDLEQPDFAGSRSFDLDRLEQPRLVGWAARTDDIEATVQRARDAGYDPGPIRAMSRRLPDGEVLDWRLTEVLSEAVPALIPFLIDWGQSRHPSTTARQGATLRHFHIEIPEPVNVRQNLAALGIDVPVEQGEHSRLVARIHGPAGEVVLD